MKDIDRVVEGIISRVRKIPASSKPSHNTHLIQDETLCAFIVKTVILDRAESDFLLDKGISEEKINELIDLSVSRLLEHNSPSLETLKMQVDFDKAYVENERKLEKEITARKQHMSSILKSIVSVESGDDFEAINAIYRSIFNFLVVDSHHNTTISIVDEGKEANISRAEEREIAAALESVYPKIGIKMFVGYSESEKRNQLAELANIVLGIRVFNQAIGQSSTKASELMPKAKRTAIQLLDSLDLEVENINSVCESYAEILGFASLSESRIEPGLLARWRHELTNRRQYISYLTSLLEDVEQSHDVILDCVKTFNELVNETRELIGSKATVPKQQVYPKFDGIANAWKKLLSEYQVILARSATLETTRCHSETYTPRLDLDLLRKIRMRQKILVKSQSTKSLGEASTTEEQEQMTALLQELEKSKPDQDSEEKKSSEWKSANSEEEQSSAESKTTDGAAPMVSLLSLEDTPDFMHLPLEYQGFCPWTITMKKGLLLPGKPELGVVEYNNTFNVFVDETAQKEFMANPSFFQKGVVQQAKMSPELIHLLHLQNDFPGAALSHLLLSTKSGEGGSDDIMPSDAPTVMVDAATETPVHFVEKHIDHAYEFSEWALRRKALQLANLRNMKTVSSQTERSHYRRDGETQVYLPRDQSQQTGVSRGTNPIRRHRYVSGLRAMNPSRFVKGEKAAESKVAVVELAYEL